MGSAKQISPQQVHDLFPCQAAPEDNAFLCLVIEEGGAHPYLRTSDAYTCIDEREFVKMLFEMFPGCLHFCDIPHTEREVLFTLKVDPYKLVDQVLVDRRTGQAYREIMWCWGHAMCGDTVLVPISAGEVKKLRKKEKKHS